MLAGPVDLAAMERMKIQFENFFRFTKFDPIRERWERIDEYNASIESRLPKEARSFVISDWHYNFHDVRCPHDSWLETIEFVKAKGFGKDRKLSSIRLKLLGAFHDRWIFVEYLEVRDFLISGQMVLPNGRNQDWIYDEVHLSDSGLIEHVVQFETFAFRVESADIRVSFELLETQAL
jgi:hypothetical protein